MSTKIVILSIGVLLTLIAVLGTKKGNSAKGLLNSKLGIPMGIIGILMMIYGSYSSELVNYNSQIEQVSIGNKLKVSGPVNAVKVEDFDHGSLS